MHLYRTGTKGQKNLTPRVSDVDGLSLFESLEQPDPGVPAIPFKSSMRSFCCRRDSTRTPALLRKGMSR